MSSTLKVTVKQCPNNRYALLFNNDINDEYIEPAVGEGEHDHPMISDIMHHQFASSRVAIETQVSLRRIEFMLPQGSFLDEVVAGLLELLIENIGQRTFIVYMPR